MQSGLRHDIGDLIAPWSKTFIGKNSVWADNNYTWRSIGIMRDGRIIPLPLPPGESDLTFDEMVDLRKDEIAANRHEAEEFQANIYRQGQIFVAVFWGMVIALGLLFLSLSRLAVAVPLFPCSGLQYLVI